MTTISTISRKNGKRRLGDGADLALGHALEHEQVEADRRRHLRHLDDDDDEDAEPERVDAGLLHRRHDHAHRQHDHRDAVEEAAEDDVERGQRQDQRELAQAERRDPLREMARQADVAHAEGEERGAGEDQGDHAVEARAAHQRVAEGGPVHRALGRRDHERAEHADRGRLGRGGDAGVDRAEHGDDQQHHRNQALRFAQLLGERHGRVGRRDEMRVPDRPAGDVEREDAGQDDAGDDAGDEQLRDRDVGGDAVDDHDDRGWNQQAERAGAGERAERHHVGIAALGELGQAHLADRRAGRRARARDRGEDRAADDVGVQQPAGQPLHPGRQALEHVLAEAGAKQDLAHPDEERQRGQRPARRRAPDRHRHRVAGRPRAEQLHADPGDARERQADPDTARKDQEQRADQERGDREVTHCAAPRRSAERRAGRGSRAPARR